LNPDISMEFPFFVSCCVLLAAYATSWLLIRSSPVLCACVSNCVCVLRTSTNSYSSPQYGCSTTEKSNINFTYRHSYSNQRLLLAPRQCRLFRYVDSFIGNITESAVHVDRDHILTWIPDRRDSNRALHYASLLRPL